MDKYWCPRCRTDRMVDEPHWLFSPRCEECNYPLDSEPPRYEVDYKEVPNPGWEEEDEDDEAEESDEAEEADEADGLAVDAEGEQ
jgi:hypothetical protein